MNKRVIVLIAGCLLPLLGVAADNAQSAVAGYLQALREGNTVQLNQLQGGDLAKKSGLRATKDATQYGAFLRDHYAGVTMTPGPLADQGNGQYVAPVTLTYPNGDQDQWLLQVQQTNGQWRIVGE